MAMRMATWAWFSPRARVPRGAPCIFGSIQQARTAAYAPDTPYWPQRRLRPAIWVGRQTSSRRINMSRVAPDPKMTLISAMLANCSGTGGTALLNTPFFARPRRGYIRTRKNIPSYFCNLQWKVCKTPRDGITDVQIECTEQLRLRPAPKSSRAGTLLTDPIGKQTRPERHPKIGCPSRV